MEKAIFNDDEFREVLLHLQQLMEEADALPYPNAKELVFSILQYFDSIHREPISRIMTLLDEKHPDLRAQLEADFSVKTLLGLYDLVQEEVPTPTAEKEKIMGFVPLEEVGLLNPIKKTEWLEVGHVREFEERKLYPKNFENINFLISKVDSHFYAIQNTCVDSILPIDRGELEEHFLICPWHGCRYNLKTGKSSNHPEKQLEVFPTEVEENGMLKVGIAI